MRNIELLFYFHSLHVVMWPVVFCVSSFLAVPWVGLQWLIVAFPNHTHYLYNDFGDCNSHKHHSMPGPI